MAGKGLTSNTSIIVNQPVEKVWDLIGNFHDLSWCPNIVTNCEPVGGISGDASGARRIVDDSFYERMRAHNGDVHFIGYIIEDGPPPISTDDPKGVHIQIKLESLAEDVTDLQLSVTSVAGNPDTVNFCTTNCMAMLEDLRQALG